MADNKYVTPRRLSIFLDNLKNVFASSNHKHSIADIEDYEVDTSLSPTSTNPIQNKVVDAEFDAIALAMNAMEVAIDGKSNISHNHDDKYDAKGSADEALESANTYTDAEVAKKADLIHTHSISDVTNLQNSLDSKANLSHSHDDIYYTESEVDNKFNTHNVATDTHNDIRLLIQGLTSRLNALADSDDTTLDQMSEIVDYIKANKSLIDNVTTTKVNVSDIINNLTTNVTNKPLSAAQGVAIKTLIDSLTEVVNGKAPKTHSHAISDVTNLQTTLDGKQDTITGGASTITSSNLTANRALISNSSGKVAVSAVTSTELGYLDGVTSNVQAQIDGKQPKESTTFVNGGSSYVAVRTPSRTENQYYEFWDTNAGWADIKAGKIESNGGFTGNLTGNVTGNADSATKVYSTLTNPSSGATYSIPFETYLTSSGNASLMNNDGIKYYSKEGTTSVNGVGEIMLGNSTASGTAKNKYGILTMYGQSTGYTSLKPSHNGTSNITVNLPSEEGTLALDGNYSYLSPTYKYDVSATKRYIKVCTLKTSWGSNDVVSVKFEMADTQHNFLEIIAYITCSQDGSYTYGIHGTKGYDKVHAYVYANGVLEVWADAITYSCTKIYPKSQYWRNGSVTWDYEVSSSLPTDAIKSTTATATSWLGNSETATALTSSAGSATQPVYFSNGKPVATTYALNKTVPSDAVFTDEKVQQGVSTTAYFRPLLLGNNQLESSDTTPTLVTDMVYGAKAISAQPSTGTIRASKFQIGNNATISWDTTNNRIVFSFL